MDVLNKIIDTLSSPPDKKVEELPIIQSSVILPFDKLAWEDFEKFCFQLGSKSMECIETSYKYGRKGQKQEGIDLYFRKGAKTKVWQIKRYAEFKKTDVSDAVNAFLGGKWYGKATEFTLCVSNYLDDTGVVDEIDRVSSILESKGVTFSVLNSEKLTIKAMEFPDLIKTFFGEYWLNALGISYINPQQKFDTKPVNIKKLLSCKVQTLLIPVTLIVVNLLVKMLIERLTSVPLLSIFLLILYIVLWLTVVIFVLLSIKETVGILLLKKTGKVSCFYNKAKTAMNFSHYMQNPNTSESSPFAISSVFKNEKNIIFEIKGCSCPYCQSEPVGYMYPRRQKSNSILFICNQNSDHSRILDPKENVL